MGSDALDNFDFETFLSGANSDPPLFASGIDIRQPPGTGEQNTPSREQDEETASLVKRFEDYKASALAESRAKGFTPEQLALQDYQLNLLVLDCGRSKNRKIMYRASDGSPVVPVQHPFSKPPVSESTAASPYTLENHPLAFHPSKGNEYVKPLFVNPKQFNRILKRRVTRHKLDAGQNEAGLPMNEAPRNCNLRDDDDDDSRDGKSEGGDEAMSDSWVFVEKRHVENGLDVENTSPVQFGSGCLDHEGRQTADANAIFKAEVSGTGVWNSTR